jgi:hypothetical protein
MTGKLTGSDVDSVVRKVRDLGDEDLQELIAVLSTDRRMSERLKEAISLEARPAGTGTSLAMIGIGTLDHDASRSDEDQSPDSKSGQLVARPNQQAAALSEAQFAEMSGYESAPFLAYEHAKSLIKRNAAGDRRLAAALLRIAGDAGIADAWIHMGIMYDEGKDGADVPLALSYYYKALSMTRSGFALQRLAREFKRGEWIVPDSIAAIQCLVRTLRANGVSEGSAAEARQFLMAENRQDDVEAAIHREAGAIPEKFIPPVNRSLAPWLRLQAMTDRVDMARQSYCPHGVRIEPLSKPADMHRDIGVDEEVIDAETEEPANTSGMDSSR